MKNRHTHGQPYVAQAQAPSTEHYQSSAHRDTHNGSRFSLGITCPQLKTSTLEGSTEEKSCRTRSPVGCIVPPTSTSARACCGRSKQQKRQGGEGDTEKRWHTFNTENRFITCPTCFFGDIAVPPAGQHQPMLKSGRSYDGHRSIYMMQQEDEESKRGLWTTGENSARSVSKGRGRNDADQCRLLTKKAVDRRFVPRCLLRCRCRCSRHGVRHIATDSYGRHIRSLSSLSFSAKDSFIVMSTGYLTFCTISSKCTEGLSIRNFREGSSSSCCCCCCCFCLCAATAALAPLPSPSFPP